MPLQNPFQNRYPHRAAGWFKYLFLCFINAINLTGYSQFVYVPPKHYVCYQNTSPLKIDGLLDEPDWLGAEWTDLFVDIEGDKKPVPRYETKAKMLWDTNYLYIGAFLSEPHLQGTLTERESVIFHDNDFEVFIDPDGDTHLYAELEVNALNTQWDLLLVKPYLDAESNVALDHWSYNGLRTAVHLFGTLNRPSDRDSGWSIEIAIPFDALAELGPKAKYPADREQFRLNFSRVEWQFEAVNNQYEKRTRIEDGIRKPWPEDNWVWSPQGVINMHVPTKWGFVEFTPTRVGKGNAEFHFDPDDEVRMALREVYFAEKSYYETNGTYSSKLPALKSRFRLSNGIWFMPAIAVTQSMFEATFPSVHRNALWHIRQDGRVWMTEY